MNYIISYCQFDLIHVKLINAFWIRKKMLGKGSDGLNLRVKKIPGFKKYLFTIKGEAFLKKL